MDADKELTGNKPLNDADLESNIDMPLNDTANEYRGEKPEDGATKESNRDMPLTDTDKVSYRENEAEIQNCGEKPLNDAEKEYGDKPVNEDDKESYSNEIEFSKKEDVVVKLEPMSTDDLETIKMKMKLMSESRKHSWPGLTFDLESKAAMSDSEEAVGEDFIADEDDSSIIEDPDDSYYQGQAGNDPDKPQSFPGITGSTSTLDVYRMRVCELEQDITFLKQSIAGVYDVFKSFNDFILDIDLNSVPDLIYFMDTLSEHLKETESIKNKAEDVETKIDDTAGGEGNVNEADDTNAEKKDLKSEIFEVLEKCETCKGVVSKINTLLEEYKVNKRKSTLPIPLSKRMRTDWDVNEEISKISADILNALPVFPEFKKKTETIKYDPTTYFGLPLIQGENGPEVVYSGQTFDMDQYLKQSGVKRRPSKYHCGMCSKVFNKLKYVKSHYHHQHVNQKKLYCDDCGLSFSYKSNLTRHQRLIHMGDRKEKCQECDASFGTRMQLDSHMRKVHDAPKLACGNCGQTFIQEQSLRNHNEVCPANGNPVKIMCGICMKSFSAKRYLQNHIRAKHSDRASPHICDICGKSFSSQFALKRHRVKKHKDEVQNLAISEELYNPFEVGNENVDEELDNSTNTKSDGHEESLTAGGDQDGENESMEEGEEESSRKKSKSHHGKSSEPVKENQADKIKKPKKRKSEGGGRKKSSGGTENTGTDFSSDALRMAGIDMADYGNVNQSDPAPSGRGEVKPSTDKSSENKPSFPLWGGYLNSKSFEIMSRNLWANYYDNDKHGAASTSSYDDIGQSMGSYQSPAQNLDKYSSGGFGSLQSVLTTEMSEQQVHGRQVNENSNFPKLEPMTDFGYGGKAGPSNMLHQGNYGMTERPGGSSNLQGNHVTPPYGFTNYPTKPTF